MFVGKCKEPEGHCDGKEWDWYVGDEHSQLHGGALHAKRMQFQNVDYTVIYEEHANNP
jgi:hypothetical protein